VLRIYADKQNQASVWELVLDEARFTLALSPDVSRGFSGEGQALTELANRRWEETLPRVHASLKWDTRIEPDSLAADSAFDRETVTAALGALGARGLEGRGPPAAITRRAEAGRIGRRTHRAERRIDGACRSGSAGD
jgi:hypothetical protein